MSAAKRVKLDRGGNATKFSSIESLSVDTIAIILGHLTWDEILRARVCKTFREAATRAMVPFSNGHCGRFGAMLPEFYVHTLRRYEALEWMSRALPNLQQLSFYKTVNEDLFFQDGEASDSGPASAAQRRASGLPTLPLDTVARFSQLRHMTLDRIQLDGKYPCLLELPRLQHLRICSVWGLKLDLEEMASGLPVLESLHCYDIPQLRGSVASLQKTLRTIYFLSCPGITGNLKDLASFPFLEDLYMDGVNVRGDVREIEDADFPALQALRLPISVNGASTRPLERIADAPGVMNAICRLRKRGTRIDRDHLWYLSHNSPDRYPVVHSALYPPFWIEIVVVDECVGWRWRNSGDSGGYCRTSWFGQKPDGGSSECEDYQRDMERSPFKDFANPPTRQEYRSIAWQHFYDLFGL